MSKRYKVFNKPARSYQELACLLISRGLEATLNDLVNVLQRVSYYRFSGYLVPFRRLHSDAFIEGTKLPLILDRYYFDQELRSLVFNAIDNVEIAIRNTIMHIHVRTYKAAGYRKHCTLPNLSHRDYVDLLRKISYAYSDKKETFMIHYKRKYNDFDRYPLWMAFELLTFGTIVRFTPV